MSEYFLNKMDVRRVIQAVPAKKHCVVIPDVLRKLYRHVYLKRCGLWYVQQLVLPGPQ